MKNKKLWIGITFLTLTLMLASAAILLKKLPEAYAGKLIFHGETPIYRYSGEVLDNGEVHVTVYYLYGGERGIQAYREANVQRARALLARKDPQRIWVQVTFAHPIPLAEVRSLVQETGFQVESFVLAGRNAEGGRAWCIIFGDFEEFERHDICKDPTGSIGVMVLEGWVETTEGGLGRWVADQRVYMVDTVAVEILELLAQRHKEIVGNRKIVVRAELPFSRLKW